jgi:protein-disulfide isomerase
MRKKLLLGAALIGMFTLNANAADTIDFSKLSQQDKEEIGKIASQYMIDNPEVLIGMSNALRKKQEIAQQEKMKESVRIAISKHDTLLNDKDTPFIGPADSKLAVIEFFDYNCVFCSKVAPELKEVMKNNPDVKFVFKEMPIFKERFPTSKLAAQLGNKVFKEKGSAAYLKYHDSVYATKHFEGNLTVADVEQAAKGVGVDPKVKADEFMDKVDNNMQLAQSLNINGTPSFIFMPTANQTEDNTLVMMQAASKEELQSIIDQMRAKVGKK